MPRALVFLLAWLPYAVLVRTLWWVTDDAYISFRYARHWAAGAGLRFNPGEHAPSEGYSNFLLVAVAASFERLGLHTAFWIPVLTFACGTLLLWLVFRAAQRYAGASLLTAGLATGILGACAPFAAWSTSGLETMVFALLLFACFERLVLRAELAPRGAVVAGALAVTVALTRVEGLYWGLVLAALAAASRGARGQRWARPLGVYAAVLLAGAGTHLVWKHAYHGHWFATTVHSKVAFSGARLARGIDYVVAQHLAVPALLASVAVLAVALRRTPDGRRALLLPVALMPLGFAAYAALVSGDFMAFGRFLVPGIPFTALGLAWVLADVEPRSRALAVAAGAALCGLGALAAFDLHPVPRALRERFHFRLSDDYKTEHEQWLDMRRNVARWALRGRALDAITEPGDSVVLSAIGVTAYESDLFVYDRHGFVSPEVALAPRPVDALLRTPGHDAPVDRRWFLEQGARPTILRARVWEAASAADAQGRARAWSTDLRRQGLERDYLLDVHALPGGEHRYLAVWRRADPTLAAGARIRVETLLAGGPPPTLNVALPTDAELGLAPY